MTRPSFEMADEVIYDLGVVLCTIDSSSDEGLEIYEIVDRARSEVCAFQERVVSAPETGTAGDHKTLSTMSV